MTRAITCRLPRSMFGRLLLLQGSIVVALAVALPLMASWTLGVTANSFITARLARTADMVAVRIARPERLAHVVDTRMEGEDGSRRVIVFDAAGRPADAGTRALPMRLADVPHGLHDTFARHGRYDVLTRPIRRAGRTTGWILVAQDRTVPDEILDDVVHAFLLRLYWIVPVALLASLAVSLLAMRRLTGNFRRAAIEADAIGISRLDVRIDRRQLPSEAAPLVHATNRAIDRLEAGYQAQKEFVGNVAHELRTPLALLSLHTERLPPSSERELLMDDLAQANHVVRQLMELASIDRLHHDLVHVRTVEIARDVVETMVPLVYRAGHTIALETPLHSPSVQAVHAMIAIALTNLIDNAVRHTPQGSAITVTVEADGSLVVDDDGPGLAVEARSDRTRRFRRGDTARTDAAGLGLAIVERIMSVCGGTLEAERSPAGGARLRLRFAAQA